MSDQTSLQLSIVDARSVDENAPQGLMALRISQRGTIGQSVSVCAVGDIGLSGRAAVTAKRRGEDALFSEIAPLLRGADVVVGNLEYPLTSEIAAGKMFAAPIGGAAALRKAGFKLLHLANNHVGEYGQTGLAATLDAVRRADMTALGAGDDLTAAHEVRRMDVNGVRIGWLGCGRTLLHQNENGPRYWEFDEKELLAAILRVRSNVDVLIASIHIGLMYLDYPRPEHKVMAEKLMAAGGSDPHASCPCASRCAVDIRWPTCLLSPRKLLARLARGQRPDACYAQGATRGGGFSVRFGPTRCRGSYCPANLA